MKIFITAFTAAMFSLATAQDSGDSKGFRFGLKVAPSLNWYKPDDIRKFENAGVTLRFSWGLMTEFKLAEVASFATGFQLEKDGGKIGFKTPTWYVTALNDMVPYEEVQKNFPPAFYYNNGIMIDPAGKYKAYLLAERSYKVSYITIPAIIKMKTKEIGYLTYFGQFGLNTSVKTKAKVKDEFADGTSLKDQVITDDIQFFRLQLSVGGGAEYNLAGTTSLVAGINYNFGFSNALKKESKYLFHFDPTTLAATPVKQKATSNNVMLTVGILF